MNTEIEEGIFEEFLKEQWKKIRETGEGVSLAYSGFLKASDALADLMDYDRDWVLRQTLPGPAYRRDKRHILEFLESKEGDWGRNAVEKLRSDRAKMKRDALMARLKLTNDEMKILGISKLKQ